MMRRVLLGVSVCLGLLLCGSLVSADDPDPLPARLTPADIAKAEKVVRAHLEKIKGNYANVTFLKDPVLERALLGQAFFLVLYPQYPIGRTPPTGLKFSNVFAVRGDKFEVLTDTKGLEKYFQAHLSATTTKTGLEDAVRAWLVLSQQFRQDGLFKFVLEDSATRVTNKTEGWLGSGKVVVMSGGNGTLTAQLTFDKAGKLTATSEESTIRPGLRPICQATKLLDADPIVRRMAEQDLLIMGRAARPYLDEQRARARPELRKAIDVLWQKILEQDRD